jgi:hypothetical protein
MVAVVAIGFFPVSARGATVRTIDDKSTSGTVKGFERGELLLQLKPSDPAVVRIPLAEIVEITLKATVAKPSTGMAASTAAVNPLGVLGSIFGLTPSATAPSVNAPVNSAPAQAVAAVPTPVALVTPVKPVAVRPATKSAQHSNAPVWQIEFAGGDHVSASLGDWTGDRVRLGLDSLDGAPLEIPVDRLHAIWSSSDALVKKAKELNQSATAQDVVFIEKDNEVKSVAGVAAGIDGNYLTLKFEGEDRRIKLDRVVGILLAQREIGHEKSMFEVFTLVRGEVLSGRIESIEKGVLRLKPLLPGEKVAHLDIPLDQLASIDIKNGRLTWLGDLPPTAVSQIPYFDRLMPYRVNQSLTGGELTLSDGHVSKGIAVHTKCALTYGINGAFERFRVKVGFQQPEGKAGRAAVRILGDGKVLWEESDLRGDATKPVAVDLSVAKVQSLTLEADYGANFDVAGRIVWGDARLVKAAK